MKYYNDFFILSSLVTSSSRYWRKFSISLLAKATQRGGIHFIDVDMPQISVSNIAAEEDNPSGSTRSSVMAPISQSRTEHL